MNNKPIGSPVTLVLWIIFFWPIAIGYYVSRDWSQRKHTLQDLSCTPQDKQKLEEYKNQLKSKGDK